MYTANELYKDVASCVKRRHCHIKLTVFKFDNLIPVFYRSQAKMAIYNFVYYNMHLFHSTQQWIYNNYQYSSYHIAQNFGGRKLEWIEFLEENTGGLTALQSKSARLMDKTA